MVIQQGCENSRAVRQPWGSWGAAAMPPSARLRSTLCRSASRVLCRSVLLCSREMSAVFQLQCLVERESALPEPEGSWLM